MNIRQTKTLKLTARELLSRAPQLRQILLVYCGIVLASCLVTTGLGQGLGSLISRSGGLGNLGTRSMLSTFQTLLDTSKLPQGGLGTFTVAHTALTGILRELGAY